VKRQVDTKKYSFYATLNSRVIGTLISSIGLKSEFVGWVVVLQPALRND